MHTILRALIYSNLLPALVVVCLTVGNCALLDIPLSGPLLAVVGAGSFLIYLLDRLGAHSPEDRINQQERSDWLRKHRSFCRISFVVGVLFAVGGYLLISPSSRIVVLGCALVGALYIFPMIKGRRLKSIPYGKSFFVGGGLALGTTLLPLIESGSEVEPLSVAFLGAYRMLYVLPNLLMSNWPDRTGDDQFGIYTLASRLTFGRLSAIAQTIAVCAFVLGVSMTGESRLFLVDAVGAAVTLILIRRMNEERGHRRVCGLDMALLWPLVTWIASR